MSKINARLTEAISSSDNLAEVVRDRGVIRVDPGKLREHAVKVLDSQLKEAVKEPISRLESSLSNFEDRIAMLGLNRIKQAGKEVDRVVDSALEVERSVSRAERRIDELKGLVAWTTVGRIGLAIVPFAAIILVIGGLLSGGFHALGIGPLLGWAWASFEAATTWWAKTLIALAVLTGIGLFGWVVKKLAGRLSDEYSRW